MWLTGEKYDWLTTWSRPEKAKWLTDDLSQYDWRRRRNDDVSQWNAYENNNYRIGLATRNQSAHRLIQLRLESTATCKSATCFNHFVVSLLKKWILFLNCNSSFIAIFYYRHRHMTDLSCYEYGLWRRLDHVNMTDSDLTKCDWRRRLLWLALTESHPNISSSYFSRMV